MKGNNDRIQKLMDEQAKLSIQCNCGRKELIPIWMDKKLCSWCGNYIYRNKKLEFKERLKKELKYEKEVFQR